MSFQEPPHSEHLLPPNATALEKALSASDKRLLDAPIWVIRAVWDPDLCPAHLLPYLAQAWSVDEWDPDWSEQDKRDAIRESVWIHQHKGTIGALKRAIARLGMGASVSRWFEHGGAPYTFRLSMVLQKGMGWNKAESDRLYRTAISAKAVRSYMDRISLRQPTVDAPVRVGAVTITRLTLGNHYAPVDLINTPNGYVYCGAAIVGRLHIKVGV